MSKEKTKLSNREYEKELERLQAELVKLQYWVKNQGLKVIIVFEGRDAAGKGGAIRRVAGSLDARDYQVIPVAAPTDEEVRAAYEEALELYEMHQGALSLVVLDVIMPVMNGPELVAKLRRNIPDLAALFMSGYTADVIAHHGVLDEGIQFLQKPFTLRKLAASVREALGES